MAKERGLIKEIAFKRFGGDVKKAKHELMKVAVEAARELVRRAGISGKPGLAWFVAMKAVMSKFWKVVKEKKDIPTVEEVLAAIPDIDRVIELIKRAYEVGQSLGV